MDWVKAGVMTVAGTIAGRIGDAGSQNSKVLGKGLMKNSNINSQFTMLANAVSKYASGDISKRGMTGTFNLYGKQFVSSISKAIPGLVAKETARNLGKILGTTSAILILNEIAF